jgi:hypothetical protein
VSLTQMILAQMILAQMILTQIEPVFSYRTCNVPTLIRVLPAAAIASDR